MIVKQKHGSVCWIVRSRWSRRAFCQCLLALGLALAWIGPGAVSWVHATAGNPYESLSRLEQSLYAKHYASQTIGQRLDRIELSLMGQRQSGTFSSRINVIEDRLASLLHDRAATLEQERTLRFVEQRFYQQVQSRLPLDERLGQLETTLYGQSQPQIPLADRLARLRQAVPLNARQVRLQTQLPQATPTDLDYSREPLLLPDPPLAQLPAGQPPSAQTPPALKGYNAAPMTAPVPAASAATALLALTPLTRSHTLLLEEDLEGSGPPPSAADSPIPTPPAVASQPLPNQRYDTPPRAVQTGDNPPMAVRFQRWLLLWWLSATSR